MRGVGFSFFISAATLFFSSGAGAADGNDAERANAYDDGWEVEWVDHSREIYDGGVGKTGGFVLQVGDSITHSNPYSQWPRNGAGKTADDEAYFTWSPAGVWGNGESDTDSTNGWYLAAADTSGQRGMTSSSGIDTIEFLSGGGNGGATMPALADPAQARAAVADGGSYSGNLHIETVAAAFEAAEFGVLMLGTNDLRAGISAPDFATNMGQMVDALEARDIVVVLSTIPPQYDDANGAGVDAYNDELRSLAQSVGLPLIDFHEEIVARQPAGAWNGTLLGMDDVHPSASGAGFNSSDDPYSPSGDAAMHCTGDAASNVGYLLRSWLAVQKMKEVKAYVVDGVDPPGGGDDTGSTDDGGTGDTGDATDNGDTNPPDTGATDDNGDSADATASLTGADATATQTAGDESGSSDGTASGDDDDSGCGCRHRNGSALPWLLVLFIARRRRPLAG